MKMKSKNQIVAMVLCFCMCVCATAALFPEQVHAGSPVSLSVSTIEIGQQNDDYQLTNASASFTPDGAYTANAAGAGDGLKIDYKNPALYGTPDAGYTKLAEYHLQVSTTETQLTGKLTLPLPAGYDGTTAKIKDGASASGATATTVTFDVTLTVNGGTANLIGLNIEYKPSAGNPGQVQENGSESGCSHSFEWTEEKAATADKDAILAYKCTKCGKIEEYVNLANSAYFSFSFDTADKIRKAPQNGTVTVDTTRWVSFYKNVMEELTKRPDVTLVVKFTYHGERKIVTITPGTDAAKFIDTNGYTGFLYLISQTGETTE